MENIFKQHSIEERKVKGWCNHIWEACGLGDTARQTCMFLRSWKISMVLRTMSWTVSWPMRHSDAVLTSRAAWACCCCCCGGGWEPKGDTSGGVVIEAAGEDGGGAHIGPDRATGQADPHQHTFTCLHWECREDDRKWRWEGRRLVKLAVKGSLEDFSLNQYLLWYKLTNNSPIKLHFVRYWHIGLAFTSATIMWLIKYNFSCLKA